MEAEEEKGFGEMTEGDDKRRVLTCLDANEPALARIDDMVQIDGIVKTGVIKDNAMTEG